MAVAHSSAPLKKLCVGLCILFYAAHIFFHISSEEFHMKSIYRDSHQKNSAFLNLKLTVQKFGRIYIVGIYLGGSKILMGQLTTTGYITWFLCEPCDRCYPHQGLNIFDPKKSRTYRKSNFSSTQCISLPERESDDDNKCSVTLLYIPRGKLKGGLGEERFKIRSNGVIVLKKLMFVCVNEVDEYSQPTVGSIDLSRHRHSLVSQLEVGNFSYCLPKTLVNGWIAFGPSVSAPRPGSITIPLVNTENNLYSVKISSIMVEDGEIIILNPPNDVFVVSSGSPMTLVDHTTLMTLMYWIQRAAPYTVVSDDQYHLCFIVDHVGVPNLPRIKVEFGIHGTIYLDHRSCFLQVGNKWCFYFSHFVSSEETGPILGSWAQAGREIMFGLSNNEVSISTIVC